MIRNYEQGDALAVYHLWNTAGSSFGYAPLEERRFRELLLEHPAFLRKYAFVLEEAGEILGFVSGSVVGDRRLGYINCLLLDAKADTMENTEELLAALERALRENGAGVSKVSFFNPIRLPWVIPGTDGHQHNNSPGMPVDIPLYGRLLALGYQPVSRECGMYLDLANFRVPEQILEKAEHMAAEGYRVDLYDPAVHTGLEEMLETLLNPLWCSEIPAAAREGKDLLVGLYGDTVAGFAGPIYPEDTGRGYFAGIGVAPEHEHHGLGTLLFYRLCLREKENGALYMSLFTGEHNPAQRIYQGAGFRVVRKFDTMIRKLEEN